MVSVAIKAEFHTNRTIKTKDSTEKNNGTYSANYDETNDVKESCDEVKELNYQEKARLQELYEASMSLSCPLEQDKDVRKQITSEYILSTYIINYLTR